MAFYSLRGEIIFFKTQPHHCVNFVEDLHEVLHFSYNSLDEIVDILAQARSVINTITHRIYQPNRSYIDSSFLKVFAMEEHPNGNL
jgi:hypothetical protein